MENFCIYVSKEYQSIIFFYFVIFIFFLYQDNSGLIKRIRKGSFSFYFMDYRGEILASSGRFCPTFIWLWAFLGWEIFGGGYSLLLLLFRTGIFLFYFNVVRAVSWGYPLTQICQPPSPKCWDEKHVPPLLLVGRLLIATYLSTVIMDSLKLFISSWYNFRWSYI